MSYKPDAVDVINDCAYIISFLSQAVAPPAPGKPLQFSPDAQEGLSQILTIVSNRLAASSMAIQDGEKYVEVCP